MQKYATREELRQARRARAKAPVESNEVDTNLVGRDLTEAQVLKMFTYDRISRKIEHSWAKTRTTADWAAEFGVAESVVRSARMGVTWTHLRKEYLG